MASLLCLVVMAAPLAVVAGAMFLRTAIRMRQRDQGELSTIETTVPSFGRALVILLYSVGLDLAVVTFVGGFIGLTQRDHRPAAYLITALLTAVPVLPVVVVIHISVLTATLRIPPSLAGRLFLVQLGLAVLFAHLVGVVVAVSFALLRQ